ncbi:MAG: hypothetical protein A3G23_00400 [Bacteroidetes bacterium RIFCSPLOWO2_12_FULL_37_12]|nr:MAG: hypothetical protein A3G23_00400 [Bacteroidetes bacterium RIFCSPLOWO2_12_FULL_37_12]
MKSIPKNIAQLLKSNSERFQNHLIFRERNNNGWKEISWSSFYKNVLKISFNLKERGFEKGDKMMIYSPNRAEMLQLSLAVMASGGISVPVFAHYRRDTILSLINHSDARFLTLAGEWQAAQLSTNLNLKEVFIFDTMSSKNFTPFLELLDPYSEDYELKLSSSPDEICLNMYTSGTMGIPKCVQLSHRNILSQQEAMSQLWNVNENDRYLSYLPWHHSFGGIFELFSSLYNGATMSLESGFGKDAGILYENWKLVKPTVFFSVPRVYENLINLCKEKKEADSNLFHPELKFIFTAAAPLPSHISDEFEKRNIPIMEGWGLTETSPCCTITPLDKKRKPGYVGFPIPGVTLKIMDDGEILVKGPNVMAGYYKNDNANKEVFAEDGWFRTGDVGEMTEDGLKLIARKDRIFKLTNGEKVIPSELESLLQCKCHYISFAFVTGNGKDHPVAILFPNQQLLRDPSYNVSPLDGCFCPRSIYELGKCLRGCMSDVNNENKKKFTRIKSMMLVDDELSIEKQTLTPSLKASPGNILNIYKAHLENLYGAENSVKENVYVINLDQ